MFKHTLIAAALAITTGAAQADTLALWNFNDSDAIVDAGAGTITIVGGSTATTYVSDFGSSDPASTGFALSITGLPAQGTGDMTRGFQFDVATTGFENISFSFDNRNSNTAARHAMVQYALDGSSFVDALLITTDVGGTFFNGRLLDLSAVAGVADNAHLALRIVTTFAPGTGGYEGASVPGTYSTAGTVRLDMVSVSGTPIAAVPEPATTALLLAGLGAVGWLARRRSA